MFKYFKDHKEEFIKHYHKRNNAESVFAMMNRKFGEYVRSKKSLAHDNEILCKALCHNIVVLIHEMFKLGIKVDFSDTAQEFVCKIELQILLSLAGKKHLGKLSRNGWMKIILNTRN